MVIDEKETHPEVATRPDVVGYDMAGGGQRLESCHGVWIFDFERRRFCRVPAEGRPPLATEWSRYYDFEVDLTRGCFSITLTEDGASVLRSWFHVSPCRFCSDRDRRTDRLSPESKGVEVHTMPPAPFSLAAMARALRAIAATIQSDYPVESNALTNMAATLASLSAVVRRIDSDTKHDPAAAQETL